jgi:hypothetical protein
MSKPVHVPSSAWNSNGSYGASEQTVRLPALIGVKPAAVVESELVELPPHAETAMESAASDASRRVERAMGNPWVVGK